jgi:hypothetical protein
VIFGNRAYGAKLAAAVVLVAVFGILSHLRAAKLKPALSHCLAQPERFDGAPVWFSSARVASVHEGGWVVASDDVEVRVPGPAPAAPGTPIALSGTFRAQGPRVDPLRHRLLPPDSGARRRLVEAVSLLVLLGVLANAARAFRLVPSRIQLERKEDA